MASNEIRFGIGDPNHKHSMSWKLWSDNSPNKSELYITQRKLGGIMKVSFHQSGSWHISFSKSTYLNFVKGAIPTFNDRFIKKWERPEEIAPGITLALRIIIPNSSLNSNSQIKKPSKVKWINPPEKEKAIEVYIFITTESTIVSNWPGKNGMGTEYIGSFQMNNGETVWAVYKIIETPTISNLDKGKGYPFKGKTFKDLEKANSLKAIFFADHNDGSKIIYEAAIKVSS